MDNKQRIAKAIENTKRIIPGYFEKTCMTRTEVNAVGSYFKGISTAAELERELRNANWSEKKHPAVMDECTSFLTTDIPDGIYGLIAIPDLPDDAVLTARDDKDTGNISMVVTKDSLSTDSVKETWIILGPEQGEEVVYTFHPGAPVPRSTVTTKEVSTGTRLTKSMAMELGFNLAKIE